LELRASVGILRAHARVIGAGVASAILAAFLITALLPRVYVGTATLIVGSSLSAVNPDLNQLLVSQQLQQTYAEVAVTRPILDVVISDLGLGITPEKLRAHLAVDAPRQSTLLRIGASSDDAEEAAAIANAVAGQLIEVSPAIEGRVPELEALIQQNLRAMEAIIAENQAQLEKLSAIDPRTTQQEAALLALQDRAISLRTAYVGLLGTATGSAPNLLSIIEPAVAPDKPASPSPLLNVGAALVLGLLVMVGAVFVMDHVDDTIKSEKDVRTFADLPTLGTIAKMRLPAEGGPSYSLTMLLHPYSAPSESFRSLRTNLDFAGVDQPLRLLLVTSPGQGDGKTTVAANLAVAFAATGRRTLLVDADLRVPILHEMFRLPNDRGLTSMLLDEGLDLNAIAHETEQPNLRVVTSGPQPPNPAELLGSQRMRTLMSRLAEAADMVIVDSPPLGTVTDAAVVSADVDGTIVVARARKTHRDALQQCRDALQQVGARVLGVVLNGTPNAAGISADGYQYYRPAADEALPAAVVGGGTPDTGTGAPTTTAKS
jgi:succinoglycan biosynthesis transport protein ExoP